MPDDIDQLEIPLDMTQECRSCHELKPRTAKHFVTWHRKLDTLCRECNCLRTRVWRMAHPDTKPRVPKPSTPESRAKAKEYQRRWRKARPEYYTAQARLERARNRRTAS